MAREVARDVLDVVRLRNRLADMLGFTNYHSMSLMLSGEKPREVELLMNEVDELSRDSFAAVKEELDETMARRCGITREELRPWHYQGRFFQEAPDLYPVDFDKYYKDRDLERLTIDYYRSIGLDVEPMMRRSDLYPREGKNQHAFCIDMDGMGDVRVLCNLTDNERWMETMLHEFGHAAYSVGHDSNPDLPFLLREAAGIFTTEGVVCSDSDELEGRFPSGDANLCTSCLYYDALNSAVYLGRELGLPSGRIELYARQARKLRKDIGRYFGADVEGFRTYRYYDGNDVLRAWICIPLTVGIYDRAEGTADALFSPRLWTENGLLTEAGDKTYWDRSTLYALRGVFACGETDRALEYLRDYSRKRLLGDHVPYPIEAWPEGNQRHLSAESGLYCRIFTEGLFGIRPTGFRSFELTPRLPAGWDRMALRHVRAFGSDFDVVVERDVEAGQEQLRATVLSGGKVVGSFAFRGGDTIPFSVL